MTMPCGNTAALREYEDAHSGDYDALLDQCATAIVRAIRDGQAIDIGRCTLTSDDFATHVSERRGFDRQNWLCLTDPIAYGQWLNRCLEDYARSNADSLAQYRLTLAAEDAADARADFMEDM